MPPRRIALIGLGAIAARHLRVTAAHGGFAVVAGADPLPGRLPEGVAQYTDHRELLAAEKDIEAVVISTPPNVRGAIALDAIAAGKHVLLEKPPCATIGEMLRLEAAAGLAGVTVFGAWHSHFNVAVERARELLAADPVADFSMVWNEDVVQYHPNQDWIWRAGGLGVFDFGVNGLAILTHIMAEPLVVRSAGFTVRPGTEMPIAVAMEFAGFAAADRRQAVMDWRTEVERHIEISTRGGKQMALRNSGRRLDVGGQVLVDEENLEYPRLYDRFEKLIAAGRSELDIAPLVVVADAFLVAHAVPEAPAG